MTREELKELYNKAGVDALIDIILALNKRIAELEAKLGMDSNNSSKPPSSDGYKKRNKKNLRIKTGKEPGGQPGHKGETLRMVEHPKYTIFHNVATCSQCGVDLTEIEAHKKDRRQVFDLPPMEIEVTEHISEHKKCPCCGLENKGTFPDHAKQSVQYGPHIKSFSVRLQQYDFIPFERTQELIEDLFKHSINVSTLFNFIQECSEKLKPAIEIIKTGIINAKLAHGDETGIRCLKILFWIHSYSTERLTFYGYHRKRGKEGMDAIGILPFFTGRLVHDFWKAYFNFIILHALCNAHILRELKYINEELNQEWAKMMIDLLLNIKKEVENAQSQGLNCLPTATLSDFEIKYDSIVGIGLAANPVEENIPENVIKSEGKGCEVLELIGLPPKEGDPASVKVTKGKRGRKKQSPAKNLLDRLNSHKSEILAFMYDFDVPFDNNLAERDIRMVKLRQKISGCFRSEEGLSYFCTIRSYMSTMRKQNINVYNCLVEAFSGRLILPQII